MIFVTGANAAERPVLTEVGLNGVVLASVSLAGSGRPASPAGRQLLIGHDDPTTTCDRAYFALDGRLAWIDDLGMSGDAGVIPDNTPVQRVTVTVSGDDREAAVAVEQDMGDHVHEEIWVSRLPLGGGNPRTVIESSDLRITTEQSATGQSIVVTESDAVYHLPAVWLGDRLVVEAMNRDFTRTDLEVVDPGNGHALSTPCPQIPTSRPTQSGGAYVFGPVTAVSVAVLCGQQTLTGSPLPSSYTLQLQVDGWDGRVLDPPFAISTFLGGFALSPDGSRIVAADSSGNLIVMPVGGGAPVVISMSGAYSPAWIDARHIVAADPGDPDNAALVHVYAVSGTKLTHGQSPVGLPPVGTLAGVIPSLMG
jgi:hypothetical protein